MPCKFDPGCNPVLNTCDIFTTLSARSSFPRRSMRKKVGEMGRAAAKSSVHELQTTRKSIQLKAFLAGHGDTPMFHDNFLLLDVAGISPPKQKTGVKSQELRNRII